MLVFKQCLPKLEKLHTVKYVTSSFHHVCVQVCLCVCVEMQWSMM